MERILRIFFRTLLAMSAAAGILLQTLSSEHVGTMLSFYTIQSNIICFVVFAALVWRDGTGKRLQPRLYSLIKGSATVCIMLTFIIYHFLLRPVLFTMDIGNMYTSSLSNTLVHYVVPLGVFTDYLVFDAKGKYRAGDPIFWAAIPFLYLTYTALYRLFGGHYQIGKGIVLDFPYFFLDYITYGWGSVLVWITAIIAGFLAVSYLIVGLDALWGKLSKKTEKE